MTQRPGRGEIFVRGKYDDGRWGNIDVFDLDDESFRAVILGVLRHAFVGLVPDVDPPPLRAKEGLRRETDDD